MNWHHYRLIALPLLYVYLRRKPASPSSFREPEKLRGRADRPRKDVGYPPDDGRLGNALPGSNLFCRLQCESRRKDRPLKLQIAAFRVKRHARLFLLRRNDALSSASGSITYRGTFSLSLPESLAGGERFKLFEAASYSGSFAALQPATPGPGLTWDTSSLAADGTLKIGGSAQILSKIGSVLLTGSTVVFTGTGGTSGGSFYVLTFTNVALPLGNWTRVASNPFSTGGNFSITNDLNPNTPQQFYVLQLP